MSKKTFISAYEEYLIYAKSCHKDQGYDGIERNLRLHILPFFKDKNIPDIKQKDIINWKTEILKSNYSNNFNENLYHIFSGFISYCVNCSYLKENIVLKVGNFKKKIEKKEHTIYTLKEFRKFRRYIKNNIYKQFFNFMFFYGTRPSEAMALRFCDLNGSVISINHNIQRRKKRKLDTPKNQSSYRSLNLSFIMLFRIWRLKKYYLKIYGDFNTEYFIFGGLKPLASSTIDRYKEQAIKKAKTPYITQHEFRHSYTTRMIHKKKPIDFVSSSLGHSRVSTTTDIYLHYKVKKGGNPFYKILFHL